MGLGDILQPTHLLFILFVALLVLGPKRLPEVGRSLGRGIRDFRSAMSGIESEFNEHTNLMTAPAPAPVTPAPQIAAEVDEAGTIAMVSPAAPQPLPEPPALSLDEAALVPAETAALQPAATAGAASEPQHQAD